VTPHLDAAGLAPEIVLTATFVAVLAVDLVGPRARRWVGPLGAIGALGAFLAVVVLGLAGHRSEMVDGAYVVDGFALVTKGLVLAAGAAVLLMSTDRRWPGEYVQLLLASLLGMSLVSSSRDLLMLFVAFELLALPGYVLVAWRKSERVSSEAAVKYFVQGVVASGVMLYGISLVFGLADGTRFDQVAGALATQSDVALARIAVVMVLVGLVLKVGAAPLHFWAPDVYEGAPVGVAAFLSVASKMAGFIALAEVVLLAFPAVSDVWGPLLWVVAALTMTVGNLVALRQTGLLRLLAWSSIAQTGYVLVPLAVTLHYGGTVDLGLSTIVQFLMIYGAMNLGAFAVALRLVSVRGTDRLSALHGMFRSSPALATLLAVFLLSLAGVPPFGGWFAKLAVMRSGIEAGSGPAVVLVVVAAVNSAIGLVYYVQVIRRLWLDNDGEDADEVNMDRAVPFRLRFVLGAAAALTLATGVLPGIVTHIGDLSSFVQ
jgi:NADH-quinone oxidoreductase subunit N